MSKVCSKCTLSFEESFFLSGRSICRSCRSASRKEIYLIKNNEKKNVEGVKECNICKEEKDVSQFKIGLLHCSDCYNKKRRDYRALAKQPDPEPSKIILPEGYQLCKVCNSVKKHDEFREKRLKCKKCENKERVAYKKGQIEKQPQANVEKEEDDFSLKLKASCRARIREVIPDDISEKVTKENRFGYIYEFLNCDMNFLKRWLQYNYTSEMTNDNYGTYWFMDHVIPVAKFKIKENFEIYKKSCFSWYNISAMTSLDNCRKSVSIDKKQLQTHKERLINFCALNGIEPEKEYLLLLAKYLDAGNPLESSITTSF